MAWEEQLIFGRFPLPCAIYVTMEMLAIESDDRGAQ